ncbi:Calcium-independent phospholipase A2-gamma [Eumeta japonica]|uniref:Calcium-independent phospholipase A2-gamma n=1 Tax=Eumeta variegata TaxID=151549 RepID=A0A4C1WXU9_EUMVA|nr:Calcium-independent phospholipase A2-gamma [Eumeta japonica]
MSSFGNQWRFIRHYLSMTNLSAELEKVVQKMKPLTPEQWDSLIRKFEKAMAVKILQDDKDVQKTNPIYAKNALISSTKTEKPMDIKDQKDTLEIEKSNTETDALTSVENNKIKTNGETKDSVEQMSMSSDIRDLSLDSLLQGLKLKKDLAFGKISEPSWKSVKPTVTKTSIHSRTAYVISAIVSAETSECLLKRTEHFIDHLKQYPEARDYAIKEGGVRALLRVQRRLKGNAAVTAVQINGVVNEALALMGYTGPTKGPGPNILSIDGGGIRGLIAIEILRELEKLTGKKVSELFDFIIGVSTGAIIAAVIGSNCGNLQTASDMYYNLSKKMFGSTTLIGGASRLVWTQSYYDTEAWEKMLQENLKECTLTGCNRHNTPKMALVSCVVNYGSRLSPFLFRTYETPFRVRSVFPGTSQAQIWQAVRASAAAPTYFSEYKLHGLVHQDGGIIVNNPTGVGIHEAKLLFGPDTLKSACVISLGTGKILGKHLEPYMNAKEKEAAGTSWKDKFNKILDSATDTEGVHLVLNDLLPPGSYYRFNPPIMEACAMDEVNPEKLNNLVRDTESYIRRNQHKFEQASAMLMRKRPLTKRAIDYIQYQSQILGVIQSN